MKPFLLRIPVLFSIAVMLNACSSVNNIYSTTGDDSTSSASNECFVQLKNGEIQYYKTLTLQTGIFTSPYLLADGKKVINSKAVRAYQTGDVYAICEECLQFGRKSKVAREALPGFAVRIVTGKMNVYSRMYFNGAEAVEELYLQLGDDGKIVPYKAAELSKLIQDNARAMEILNGKEKSISRKLQAVAEVYNRQGLVAR